MKNQGRTITELESRIIEFIEEYNDLLEGLDDELGGISEIGKNKKIKSISEVKLADLECDEILMEEYYDIKDLI